MSSIHTLKNTPNEVVLKIYSTEDSGETISANLDSSYITSSDERFVGTESKITIREMHWGAKHNKHIDVTRVTDHSSNTVHGHYYLVNNGTHNFDGFVDDTYANTDLRIVSDGPFHLIIKLGKSSFPKV